MKMVSNKKKVTSKWYLAETITDADYADNLTLLANTPSQDETQLYGLCQAASGIGLSVNSIKTVYVF